MDMIKSGFAKLSVLAATLAGGVCLSGCVSQEYVDQRIAEVNTHVSAVDARVTAVDQKADAALSAAQAAQAAAAQANQRIDTLSTQVNSIQQAPPRAPRG
jgi:outer membrane murein-binding lipoprotein Lpp